MRAFSWPFGAPIILASSLLLAACAEPVLEELRSAAPIPLQDEAKLPAATPSAPEREERARIEEALQPSASADPASLLSRAPTYARGLDFDPLTASNLSLIQASSLSLNDAERAQLAQQGFVIAKRRQFPNMAYGYKVIYGLDLPVFVSLDAILETVHLSYKAILKLIEERFSIDDLRLVLTSGRSRLTDAVVTDPEIARDLDLYLAIALSLLEGKLVPPVRGADAAAIEAIVKRATAGEGMLRTPLFGQQREIDYSQLKPRAHYLDTATLQRYFRATMWLGRTDFRLIETLPNGERVFRRRQFDAMLALRSLLEGPGLLAFARIDAVIGAFVGEHDYMALDAVDALVRELGEEISTRTDEELAELILARGYGAQRVASQILRKDPALKAESLPLDRSFALLGQRYTVDAHAFSALTYDRLFIAGKPRRTLPSPLDVAYTVLGNPAALPLMATELAHYGHAPALERTRLLVDAHGDGYWGTSLYTAWLSALRAASPGPETRDPAAHGMPSFVGTEAWQRRMLNTQLASWAELRHDTMLYTKQSYTGIYACVFPDGYVDPYPEAFERLRRYAHKGQEVVALLEPRPNSVSVRNKMLSYFGELARVSSMLRDMAEHQRTGQPFDEAQMAFLNDAVKSSAAGCAGPDQLYSGWYGRLLYDRTDTEMDPCIADVHTDPGQLDRPPEVLHVAVGLPRLMVLTANTCEGPRAYAGVVSAYHELSRKGLVRMTDIDWAKIAKDAPDVPWMAPILP